MILISNLASLALTPDTVTVAGYYAAGDGGGGDFVYDAASTLAPDGGMVFNSIGPGKWIRIYSGPINVRWFGAIISSASGLTDVTAQVHAARDFASNGGTVYFPQAKDNSGNIVPYVGAFEFLLGNTPINIIGDGDGSILKSAGPDEHNNPRPVLSLGRKYSPNWRYSKVSMLTIDGTYDEPNQDPILRYSDGVVFRDNISTADSGRWCLENVTIFRCNKGIYKPDGNIGNSFTNCNFSENNFGYFAQGVISPIEMHAGCDQFLGGSMNDTMLAAIYINAGDDLDYGQLIVDGTVIQFNPGFGILIKISPTSVKRMTVNAVELRNIWMEGNATETDIWIDGVNYPECYDYYFEQVRSVAITGGMLRRFYAEASSVMLTNCRGDISTVVIDNESVVIAEGMRFSNSGISDKIIVNSIFYDGVPDYTGWLHIPTSVWGPLRVITQTGNNNIMISQQYNSQLVNYPFGDPFSGPAILQTNPETAGILQNVCASLTAPSNMPVDVSDLQNFFYFDDPNEKYYVWSIHAFQCGSEEIINGWIGSAHNDPGYGFRFGQVILKPNQWVCSYGIKKMAGFSVSSPKIYLNFTMSANAKILFCDYQVVKFENFYEAQSFLNSRAFAEGVSPCEIEEG